ncbi:MAG: hypothetical protein B6U97_02040 [Candidatus Altiarchaeales archaeon ex4484_96]|nr:MAG: hypothetical protein B6U97_02040 [Candidatus Altiarchaeales archaeon ex4484_96]
MSEWDILKSVVEKGSLSRKVDRSVVEEKKLQEPVSLTEKKLNELIINKTDAQILDSILSDKALNLSKLRKKINKSRISIYHSLNKLEEYGIIKKEKSEIKLEKNKPTEVLKRLKTKGFDFGMITGKRIMVLQALTEWKNPDEISSELGISISSAYKYINQLEPLLEHNKNDYRIKLKNESVIEFINMLEDNKPIDYVELWSTQNEALIKSVTEHDGSLTSYSKFNEYGIPVDNLNLGRYYLKPSRNLSPEEVFIHSLKSTENSAMMSYSIIFYINNGHKFNPLLVEKLASRFNVTDLWMDIQSYITGKGDIRNKKMFPQKKEFSNNFGINLREYNTEKIGQKEEFSDEVLFISKIISLNPIDLLDCEELLREKKLEWNVIKNLINGSHHIKEIPLEPIILRLKLLDERTGVRIPIIKDLRNSLLEKKITDFISEKKTIKDIQEHLQIPEYQVRNILNKMSRDYKVKKLNTKPIMYSQFLGL